MKVLLATSKIPPDYSGVAQRVVRHADYLNKKEMLCMVLTNTRSYINSENIYLKDLKGGKINSLWTINSTAKIPLLNKFIAVFNLLSIALQSAYHVFSLRRKFEIAHCFSTSDTPLLIAFFSILFKKKVFIESTLLGSDSGPKGHLSYLQNYVYKNATMIICISEALKREFIKHGYDENKIKVIPNDVDTEVFFPVNTEQKKLIKQEVGLPPDSKLILFVGALIHRKGFDILTNIFVQISQQLSDVHLLLIGSSSSIRPEDVKVKNIFNETIGRLSLKDRVHLIGEVEDVDKYMKVSDVFIFPSRREGFGTVQIEAMASGCPVIANYLPGITDEIVEDTINGFVIYEENHIQKYLEILVGLFSDKDFSKKISENAVKKVLSSFSREIIMEKYMDLYNQ